MTEEKKKNISRIIKCSGCGKPTIFDESNEFRPFCSKRCQTSDQAAWATEAYRVVGPPVDQNSGLPIGEGDDESE